MSLRVRRGLKVNFDPSKLVPGELAIITDAGEIHYCFGAGNVKRLSTIEDVQALLDISPEAYAALQALIADLENDPELATTILNNISNLQSSKLDKTGDSKDNKASFTQASTLSNINTGESHSTIFGKIKKFFAFLGTTTLTTVAQTISSAINELVSGKINKTDIVNTDTVNDTTKVASAAVARALGIEIDTLNNNLLKVAVITQQVWCLTDQDTLADFNLSAYSNILATFAHIVGVSTINDTRLTRVYGYNNRWDIVSKTSQDVFIQCIVLYK